MKYQVKCQYCGEEVEREIAIKKVTCFNCKKKKHKMHELAKVIKI